MSRPNSPLKSNLDDRLADFTDDILEGRTLENAPGSEEEMLELKETVLRLRTSFPPVNVDEARVKQMYVRLRNRMKREEQNPIPFWKKFFFNPQFGIAAGVLGILIIFILISPSLTTAGSSTAATALNSAFGPIAVVGLAAVILIIFWIKRRK